MNEIEIFLKEERLCIMWTGEFKISILTLHYFLKDFWFSFWNRFSFVWNFVLKEGRSEILNFHSFLKSLEKET